MPDERTTRFQLPRNRRSVIIRIEKVHKKKKTVNWSEITGNILSALTKWILTSFVNLDVPRSTFLQTTLRTFETGILHTIWFSGQVLCNGMSSDRLC